jgi:hypothetical protein
VPIAILYYYNILSNISKSLPAPLIERSEILRSQVFHILPKEKGRGGGPPLP